MISVQTSSLDLLPGALPMSELCRQFIEHAKLSWLPDLIWHYQSFAHFKNQLLQRWHLERQQSIRSKKKKLIISCYAQDVEDPYYYRINLLEQVAISNFAFPFEELTLLYKQDECLLLLEDSKVLYAKAN